ncbi:hypothetical protein OF122_13105 [Pelagibacterium flavum]|uniref:Uncharacterized protein n=1 Tax=Pelagibacterium flavum TaxID=2984530 RepID=A0ABY6IK70_9HYPH|nr:hypothetical protein [Pelagibacterium sp. YIM 151497]UYQ70997.1 hypothetical protein OF122_13105 [Pelagibacterium sp. YIM 151497]
MSETKISVVPFETNHKPNADGDVASLVRRLIAVEDRIDAENKMKALVFAEARIAGVDIGALKSVVRICRYLPQSKADGMSDLSDTVKQYLDVVTGKPRGGV